MIGVNARTKSFEANSAPLIALKKNPVIILILLILIIIADASMLLATQYVYVSGKIRDHKTGTPLGNVAVCSVPKSQLVYSNSGGDYKLRIVRNHRNYYVYYFKDGYSYGKKDILVVNTGSGGTIRTDATMHPAKTPGNLPYVYIPSLQPFPSPVSDTSNPPVPTLRPECLTVQGIVVITRKGLYQRSPGDVQWDSGKRDLLLTSEITVPLKGVKVYTVPATSVTYTDDFGLYSLNTVRPGVQYRLYFQKAGYKLLNAKNSNPDYDEMKLDSQGFFLKETQMKCETGRPVFRTLYGSASRGKYTNYAVVSMDSDNFYAETFYTVNDSRPLYRNPTLRNSFNEYVNFYTNPIFITENTTIQGVSKSLGHLYGSDTARSRYTFKRGDVPGERTFIILCGEIESFSENSKSSHQWIGNEIVMKDQRLPDVKLELFIPMLSRTGKARWSGKPSMASKISMNSCHPYWDMRTKYTPDTGFTFKVTCYDVDKDSQNRTVTQHLGSQEYTITGQDIQKGYISLKFGAMKKLIILLTDTKQGR